MKDKEKKKETKNVICSICYDELSEESDKIQM